MNQTGVGRMVKKLVALSVLVAALLIGSSRNTYASWFHFDFFHSCGWTCDGLSYCEDLCGYQVWDCVMSCTGYQEPDRTDCIDACYTAEFDCDGWCIDHCQPCP